MILDRKATYSLEDGNDGALKLIRRIEHVIVYPESADV
jgi:hypothetical protein